MLNDIKARYWWFVLYPESAPEDWVEQITKTGLPFCISPLHDKDKNADLEFKKEHVHVILAYANPTTYRNVVRTITEPLNQPHPQYISALKGAFRYLTHADNPEKAQYDLKDIKRYNGFLESDFFSQTTSDEDKIYDEIEDIIIKNSIFEFYHLVVYLRLNESYDLLSFLRRHTIYFKELINSVRYSHYLIDENTGEIKHS